MIIPNKLIVLRLIQKTTENNDDAKTKGILGKKALQKSIYFFNLKHRYFNFRWADYGPFNAEVQQIVQDLVHNNKISIRDMKTKKEGAVIKNMQYTSNSEAFENFPKAEDETLDYIVDFIEGKSPRDLELLASVHYWAQKQLRLTGNCDVEYIYGKLTELKPDARFAKNDVKTALDKLTKCRFQPSLEE